MGLLNKLENGLKLLIMIAKLIIYMIIFGLLIWGLIALIFYDSSEVAKPNTDKARPITENTAVEPVIQASILSRLGTYGSPGCSDSQSDQIQCVSEPDWKALCENATGIGRMAKINATGDIGTTNTKISNLNIYWNRSKEYKCRFSFEIENSSSGTVNVRRYIGAANEIYVYRDDEDGNKYISISNSAGYGNPPD